MQKKQGSLSDKQRLDGAIFRIINEKLYTSTSQESQRLFQERPQYFNQMHIGFENQASQWPIVPVDEVINYIQKSFHAPKVIADMGCGDAKIAQTLPSGYTVHSFDFQARHPCVTTCDMSHTPLEDNICDLVVFVLSLMGTNVPDFIREAHRILKNNGRLIIVEVTSRIEDPQNFANAISSYGFKLVKQTELTNFFLWFEFKTGPVSDFPLTISLKPCIYKRR